MVSLEKRDEMPAYQEEIAATLAEGITINNGWGPNHIIGDGSVKGIELKQCTRVFDENGRFSPAYDQNNLKNINADQIIVAIGQAIDGELLAHVCVDIERGCFKTDPVTLETFLPEEITLPVRPASSKPSPQENGPWNRWNAISRGRTFGLIVLTKC